MGTPRRTSFIVLACLLLTAGCSEEPATAPRPPDAHPRPFEITSPIVPVDHDRRVPLVMTWKLSDSSQSMVHIHYRPMDSDVWIHERTISAKLERFEFALGGFAQKKYRFAISTGNGKFWDSSAVVSLDWFPVMLAQPRAGELRLRSDVNRFKWVCFDDRIERVDVVWRPAGSSVWKAGWSRLAADSSLDWDAVPWTSGAILDFAIRGVYYLDAGLAPTDWSVVQNVAFGELAVTSPLPGSEWYRYLTAKIIAPVIVPPGFGKTSDAVYELSTDGGATWDSTASESTVLQSAATQAFVRVRHDGMKRAVASGPFSIVDRSSEYFSLSPGKTFRYYVFGTDATPSFTDTTSRSWHTITVLRERAGIGRTEYECSIVIEAPDGSSSTSTGLLWRQQEGQQMIGGNFEPFKNANVHGIHDISVDILKTDVVHGTPGEIPISSTRYETRRGKGIVSKTYATAVSRIPPRG
jgi:hypothetical protein